LRQAWIAAAALVTGLALAAEPATAGTTRVSGNQMPVARDDPCVAGDPSSLATYTMDGSLIGCWYTDDAEFREQRSGTAQGTGHEHFVGCLDLGGDGSCSGDPFGTLYFSFQFSGKFDSVTFAEIRGRCSHPVVTGMGGFAGAGSVINFKDDVATGIASYAGNIRLS
jgi:hypothetical protein